MQRIGGLLVVATALALAAGCTQTPGGGAVKTKPMRAGDVDTGPGSLEAERRRLQGTWDLTSLQLLSPSGESIAAQATGRLQYDEFGNLSMRGTITGAPDVDNSILNVSGHIVIDPAAHTLRFVGITAPTNDEKRIDPKLAASLIRYYELTGDQLKTTVKGASGATTAIATWMRVK
jgi:hypothetical protein